MEGKDRIHDGFHILQPTPEFLPLAEVLPFVVLQRVTPPVKGSRPYVPRNCGRRQMKYSHVMNRGRQIDLTLRTLHLTLKFGLAKFTLAKRW